MSNPCPNLTITGNTPTLIYSWLNIESSSFSVDFKNSAVSSSNKAVNFFSQ